MLLFNHLLQITTLQKWLSEFISVLNKRPVLKLNRIKNKKQIRSGIFNSTNGFVFSCQCMEACATQRSSRPNSGRLLPKYRPQTSGLHHLRSRPLPPPYPSSSTKMTTMMTSHPVFSPKSRFRLRSEASALSRGLSSTPLPHPPRPRTSATTSKISFRQFRVTPEPSFVNATTAFCRRVRLPTLTTFLPAKARTRRCWSRVRI